MRKMTYGAQRSKDRVDGKIIWQGWFKLTEWSEFEQRQVWSKWETGIDRLSYADAMQDAYKLGNKLVADTA